MKYYHQLSAPPPPFSHNNIVADHTFFSRIIPNSFTGGITQLDGTIQNVGSYSRRELIKPVQDWIFETFPELLGHSREIGFQEIANSSTNGQLCQMVPHTDGRRGHHVLQYAFETGGPDVTTVWWQEDGHPIYRNSAVFNHGINNPDDERAGVAKNKHMALHKLDLTGLTPLESVVFKKDHWYLLDADVIHSVHNVRTKRLALTVGFSNRELYELMAEKYKFK
jgi:hypothetical protein